MRLALGEYHLPHRIGGSFCPVRNEDLTSLQSRQFSVKALDPEAVGCAFRNRTLQSIVVCQQLQFVLPDTNSSATDNTKDFKTRRLKRGHTGSALEDQITMLRVRRDGQRMHSVKDIIPMSACSDDHTDGCFGAVHPFTHELQGPGLFHQRLAAVTLIQAQETAVKSVRVGIAASDHERKGRVRILACPLTPSVGDQHLLIVGVDGQGLQLPADRAPVQSPIVSLAAPHIGELVASQRRTVRFQLKALCFESLAGAVEDEIVPVAATDTEDIEEIAVSRMFVLTQSGDRSGSADRAQAPSVT